MTDMEAIKRVHEFYSDFDPHGYMERFECSNVNLAFWELGKFLMSNNGCYLGVELANLTEIYSNIVKEYTFDTANLEDIGLCHEAILCLAKLKRRYTE